MVLSPPRTIEAFVAMAKNIKRVARRGRLRGLIVLHFRGCPGTPTTIELIKEVLQEEGMAVDVTAREIRSRAEAMRWRFPGSPTILFQGRDLFPLRGRARYGLYCRVYNNEGITMSWPSKEAIRRALLRRMKLVGRSRRRSGDTNGEPRQSR